MKQLHFNPRDFVSPASLTRPRFKLGDWVQLRSGSPALLVVDMEVQYVTVAMHPGRTEVTLPAICLVPVKRRRLRNA